MKKIRLFIMFLLMPIYLFAEPIYLKCKQKNSNAFSVSAVLNLEDGYLTYYGRNNKLHKTTEHAYHFFLSYPEIEHYPSWAIELNRITLSMSVFYSAFPNGIPTVKNTSYECLKSERQI